MENGKPLEALEKYYDFVTQRYLEGTKRFHDVTNYFLVSEALIFSIFGQTSKDADFFLQIFSAGVGAVFSLIWFLVLYRIEHMRDMRKTQGKLLEKEMDLHGVARFLFRKEEFDATQGRGKEASGPARVMHNLQVSHLVFALPLLFTAAWLAFGVRYAWTAYYK